MQKKLAATLTGGFLGLIFILNSSIAGAEAAAEVRYPGTPACQHEYAGGQCVL